MYNWKVGDLAVCVDGKLGGVRQAGSIMPVSGRVYRVTGVLEGILWADQQRSLGVSVDGAYNVTHKDGFFSGKRFRPLNDEPDNAELIAKIKNCKPQKVS